MNHLDELEAQSSFILREDLILALDDGAATVSKTTTARKIKETLRAELAAMAARLEPLLKELSPIDRLRKLREEITGRVVFTTSFGLEDQVILQMLVESDIDVDLVTLDTGRLFPQTYDLWAETEKRFGRRIRAVYPQQNDVAAFVDRQGINGFYRSRRARLSCCHVRKVEPLNRALAGAKAWIVGLRAEQSAGRRDMGLVSAETAYQLIKLNPLFDWDARRGSAVRHGGRPSSQSAAREGIRFHRLRPLYARNRAR